MTVSSAAVNTACEREHQNYQKKKGFIETAPLDPSRRPGPDATKLLSDVNGRSGDLLTKEQVRMQLNLPSTRSVDELVRRRALACVRLGWRTVRFSPQAVQTAIDKLTIRAI